MIVILIVINKMLKIGLVHY